MCIQIYYIKRQHTFYVISIIRHISIPSSLILKIIWLYPICTNVENDWFKLPWYLFGQNYVSDISISVLFFKQYPIVHIVSK